MPTKTGQHIGSTTDPYFAGDDLEIEFLVEKADGSPEDVSSWAFKWAAAEGAEGQWTSPAVVAKDSAVPGEIDLGDAATGFVVVKVAGAETQDLGGRMFHHELQAIDGAGKRRTCATGQWTVREELID